MSDSHQEVIDCWFNDRARKLWFNASEAFDEELRRRFAAWVDRALAGEYRAWESSAEGSLALVILLDQIPLNIYRKQSRSFCGEKPAREVADRAIEQGFDAFLTDEQKGFLYMPFMHSEDQADQDRSVALFEAANLRENLRFARHHQEIIRKFGRFPHRNRILGRANTEAESAYLNSKEAFLG